MNKFLITVFVCLVQAGINLYAIEPPEPCYPIPNERQLAWHKNEIAAFIHFGVNTFNNIEWGNGKENLSIFNPVSLNAEQWVNVVKSFGAKKLILTCKHHDGFCLWPSAFTDHDVGSSPWKDGKGDIVKEASDACRIGGIEFGVYLSPWDMHEPAYGNNSPGDYNKHYLNQLTELLTNYGNITEVWWDGAKGWGDTQDYDWETWISKVRELQQDAVIFSDAGPDVRWCGNESATAGEPNWCMVDTSKIIRGNIYDAGYLSCGSPSDPDWCASECDTSIRPGWFYHAAEDANVKSLDVLIDTYYKSVGMGGVLLMSFPPDKRGLIHENDAAIAVKFGEFLKKTFSADLAKGAVATASNTRGGGRSDIQFNGYRAGMVVDGDSSTYWATDEKVEKATLELDMGSEKTFDIIMIQEYIKLGQRVASFVVDAWVGGKWKKLAQKKTIGNKRLIHLNTPVTAKKVRLSILRSRACPAIHTVGIFKEIR